jgi:hypothetical protein
MNAYVSHVIDTIKARDEKRESAFARSQYELKLKIASQKEVFEWLCKWLQDAVAQIEAGLDRPAVRYQMTLKPGSHVPSSIKLIGEGWEQNRVEITCSEDGTIVYSSPLVADGRQSFNPAVENGDQIKWFSTQGVVTKEEMGQIFLSVVTQVK